MIMLAEGKHLQDDVHACICGSEEVLLAAVSVGMPSTLAGALI